MRLFYAIWPDVAVQQALAERAHECQRTCGGRSIPAEKLHATVAFLGEVTDERYPSLLAIGGSLGASGCELVLDELAYWRRSRVVYAAPSRIPATLSALASTLGERLAGAGLCVEKHPFAPHVTLLRDAKRAPRAVAFAPITWRARALSLVETLRRDGKHAYRTRASWTLAK